MGNKKYFVGVDKPNGKDEGAIVEGYWFNGVYTITKVHRLTQSALDLDYPCDCIIDYGLDDTGKCKMCGGTPRRQ